jgi:hypothetical protein
LLWVDEAVVVLVNGIGEEIREGEWERAGMVIDRGKRKSRRYKNGGGKEWACYRNFTQIKT